MDKINNGLKEFRIKTSKGFASVTIGKSDLNKWTYITAVPYTYITSQTRYIKNIMLYMMLLFMVLGFAAAYKLGNWQYRPIEVLTNYTRSILNSSENNSNDSFIQDGIRGNFCRPKKEVKRTNEFAYVKQSIDYQSLT